MIRPADLAAVENPVGRFRRQDDGIDRLRDIFSCDRMDPDQ